MRSNQETKLVDWLKDREDEFETLSKIAEGEDKVAASVAEDLIFRWSLSRRGAGREEVHAEVKVFLAGRSARGVGIACGVCGQPAKIRECELRDAWQGQTRFHVDCGGHSEYREVPNAASRIAHAQSRTER